MAAVMAWAPVRLAVIRAWHDDQVIRPQLLTPARWWTIVVPVQHADRAKTRLDSPPTISRPNLARALALDSLAAVRACELVQQVLVVTSDPVISRHSATAGDHVLADPGSGLTAAIAAGLMAATNLVAATNLSEPGRPARQPGALAVLLGDVPALRPDDLTLALIACAAHERALVPDQAGTGTVLLTARLLTAGPGHGLRPAFGVDSAAHHERLGAVRLDLDLPRLRQDVDTAADLRQAQRLGVGAATTALLGAGVL
jgi:2-phospho-L-lactate/phosphoenolpyruvate guanylyltransferase